MNLASNLDILIHQLNPTIPKMYLGITSEPGTSLRVPWSRNLGQTNQKSQVLYNFVVISWLVTCISCIFTWISNLSNCGSIIFGFSLWMGYLGKWISSFVTTYPFSTYLTLKCAIKCWICYLDRLVYVFSSVNFVYSVEFQGFSNFHGVNWSKNLDILIMIIRVISYI